MTQITTEMTYNARGPLSLARDAALLADYADDDSRDYQIERVCNYLAEAAKALGFALVPLTQDKPDSGRA